MFPLLLHPELRRNCASLIGPRRQVCSKHQIMAYREQDLMFSHSVLSDSL